jgi:hypothetical protein
MDHGLTRSDELPELTWYWLPALLFAMTAAGIGAAFHNGIEHADVDKWELLWCSLAFVGMFVHFRGLREAERDRVALGEDLTNGRRRVVRGRKREELGRMIKQAGFLLVGLIVANLPGVPGRSVPSLITRLVFIGAELMMIYLSLAAQRDDAKLREGAYPQVQGDQPDSS